MSSSEMILVNERIVAAQLGVTPAALRKWRRLGQGPTYVKLGTAVRYPTAEVNAWVAARAVTPDMRNRATA